MKKLILLIVFSLSLGIQAQDTDSEAVKTTIISFFEAFHKQKLNNFTDPFQTTFKHYTCLQ